MEDIIFDFGAHLDPKTAICRALNGMNKILGAVLAANPDGSKRYTPATFQIAIDWWQTATIENQPYLIPDRSIPLLSNHPICIAPSEYFRRQCFIAIEPSEPYLDRIIEFIGTDNLIFGSDYPHMDRNPEVVSEMVGLEERLSKHIVQKILWDNPTRFYGLE